MSQPSDVVALAHTHECAHRVFRKRCGPQQVPPGDCTRADPQGGRRDRTLYADSPPPPSLPGFGWEVPDDGRRRRPKEILLDLVEGEKMGFHPMCLYSKYSVFFRRTQWWMKFILSHICWGPGAPLPFSRPHTPPPPKTQPPPRPEIGWKVGGSRRMARCYAPPRAQIMAKRATIAVSDVRTHIWNAEGSASAVLQGRARAWDRELVVANSHVAWGPTGECSARRGPHAGASAGVGCVGSSQVKKRARGSSACCVHEFLAWDESTCTGGSSNIRRHLFYLWVDIR